MIHTLADATLDEFITSAPVVVVDFFATWCGPCKRLHTELDAMSDTYTIGQIDVEENPVAMNTYNVISVPTLIVFQDGQPTQSIVGYRTRDELMKLI